MQHWLEMVSHLCPQCATADVEWIYYDAEGRPQMRQPEPYEAVMERCHGCGAIARADEGVPKDADRRGLRGVLHRVPGAFIPEGVPGPPILHS